MTAEQKVAVETLLRDGPLDLLGDLEEQRQTFEQMSTEEPLPDDVTWHETDLGGVPVIAFEAADHEPDGLILFVHGGAFTTGSARSSLPLATDLARRARRRGVTVDYRLAPEHPYPAALEDVLAAYRGLIDSVDAETVVLAGESAGGGLVLAALVSLRDAGGALPAAAAVFSPVGDLTLGGSTMQSKADVDPVISEEGLRLRGGQYVAGADPRQPTISPVFADLTGLPPLLIQAGSHEVLLDDAVRLAGAAARADVDVRLDVISGVPHVFQGFAAQLDVGAAALDRAAAFLNESLNEERAR